MIFDDIGYTVDYLVFIYMNNGYASRLVLHIAAIMILLILYTLIVILFYLFYVIGLGKTID